MTKNLNSLRSSLLLALLLVTSMAKPIMWQLDEIDETPEITWPEEAVILPQLIWASNGYLKQCDIQENTFLTLSPFKHRKTSTRPLNDISDAPQPKDASPNETQGLIFHESSEDQSNLQQFDQARDVNTNNIQELIVHAQSDTEEEESDTEESDNPFELKWHTDKYQEKHDEEIKRMPQPRDASANKIKTLIWHNEWDNEKIDNPFGFCWHTDPYQEIYDEAMKVAKPRPVDVNAHNNTKEEYKYNEVIAVGLQWDETQELDIPAKAARYSDILKAIMDNRDETIVDLEKLIFPEGDPCKELVEAIVYCLDMINHAANNARLIKKRFNAYTAQLPEEMHRKLMEAIHSLGIKPLIKYYAGTLEKIPAYNLHPLNKAYKCDWPDCFYSNDKKHNVKKHRNIHTNPFQCPYCGDRFAQEYACAEHIKIHSGEKPFECLECGKSFRVKQQLKNHMEIHKEVKRFKCDRCNKYTTSDQSNFTRHQKGCWA